MSIARRSREAAVALTLALSLASLACSSSSTASPAGGDAGVVAEAGADGALPADAAVPAGKGLTISKATVASLDGTYDIQVSRIDVAGGLAFNGNFADKIEIEIDTDASGVVKAAHVWNYAGAGTAAAPDKFYGCDGKATACTGVTVDVTTNLITLAGPTWPETESPAFDGTKPDVLVPGGAKVTVSGTIQAK